MSLVKARSRGINLADNFAFTGTITGAGGITEIDQWRISSQTTFSSGQVLSANWERSDTFFEKIGTGLSQSSGVFSFPSTGKYLLNYHCNHRANVGDRGVNMQLYVSSNSGGAYTFSGSIENNLSDIGGSENTTTSGAKSCIIDVTDSSTFRFYFNIGASSGSSVQIDGHTTAQYTGFTSIRLGDT
tara:strand:- start:307 stop:864 length:558 start_codon:yes stop_codon:yes gene_type:complete